ncbi:hypothetical protein [Bacillus multifaciens]|uniref:hypothetical protein n=1 Tax=Bacillus multifaciens TaxID=3068506 RepID=UPI00274245C4|nr:hypothetical protein [Bacillus sp. WLY-B-L8]MDP7980478.1 hypothetical protein [Bacillus sp. WLY-B-L8]
MSILSRWYNEQGNLSKQETASVKGDSILSKLMDSDSNEIASTRMKRSSSPLAKLKFAEINQHKNEYAHLFETAENSNSEIFNTSKEELKSEYKEKLLDIYKTNGITELLRKDKNKKVINFEELQYLIEFRTDFPNMTLEQLEG